MEWLDQQMDSSWGRGKFRTEVWNDDVNPVNRWWEAYGPSDEEVEAAAQGIIIIIIIIIIITIII
jgi:hypothetical protein